MPRHIVVSSVFGPQFQKLYPATDSRESILFSNRPDLRDEAINKGWRYIYLDGFELVDDDRISSQQSKYVKFLQFVKDFDEFSRIDKITYHDHKFFVKNTHVEWILDSFLPDKTILIRNTPRFKSTISDEITDAMAQQRYRVNMDATLTWIAEAKNAGASETVRIMNTGLIHYDSPSRAMPLLDRVYETVWRLGQPECQIIWAVLSQDYEACIQRVEWSDLNPLWAAPDS